MIKLGSKVRDTISGFQGICTGRFEYMYGCVRIAISPQELKDGKPIDSQVFDEQQCEVLEEKAPAVSKDADATRPGGPRDNPPARSNPTR